MPLFVALMWCRQLGGIAAKPAALAARLRLQAHEAGNKQRRRMHAARAAAAPRRKPPARQRTSEAAGATFDAYSHAEAAVVGGGQRQWTPLGRRRTARRAAVQPGAHLEAGEQAAVGHDCACLKMCAQCSGLPQWVGAAVFLENHQRSML